MKTNIKAQKKPELLIDRSTDEETMLIYLGEENVGYANHDEHGWSGMAAVENIAREMARVLGLIVKEK